MCINNVVFLSYKGTIYYLNFAVEYFQTKTTPVTRFSFYKNLVYKNIEAKVWIRFETYTLFYKSQEKRFSIIA